MAKNYFFPLKKSKILRKISRSGRSSSHLDLRIILSVRPHPPYEKNKLLLNEYLGDFMHFETIYFLNFLRKMTFSNPPTPLKCRKFRPFFETFPYVNQTCWKRMIISVESTKENCGEKFTWNNKHQNEKPREVQGNAENFITKITFPKI